MRNRNIRIQVWLSKKEVAEMDEKVRRCGLSRGAYLRQLINGMVPQDAPPADYYAMMRELYRIGNNLNQIAAKAHSLNLIDTPRYDAVVREFEAAVKTITDAVILPRPME